MASIELVRLAQTPGADPRAIMAAACSRPMNVGPKSIEFDPDRPAAQPGQIPNDGGLLLPGGSSIAIPSGNGALVNKVTPEQLLAIVASLIATSPDAATACVRLRTEVIGWQFHDSKGSLI